MPGDRRLRAWSVALMLTLAPAPASGQASEAAVKAAYLYKMAAFVTWPPNAFGSASAPFRICVLNRGDVSRPLAELARGAQAWGRPVVVSQVASAQEASQCQILFLGDGKAALSDSAPVLTVTERGAASPGVVEFTMQQSHVRFVIHRAQADSRRLQISSKLLAVAAAVVP
jgi:YfiR/HmsC-like